MATTSEVQLQAMTDEVRLQVATDKENVHFYLLDCFIFQWAKTLNPASIRPY